MKVKIKNGIQDSAIMDMNINNGNKGFESVIIVLVIFFLFGLGACTYDTLEYVPVETPDSVSFTNDLIPFFETNCAKSGCHASGGVTPDLSAANAYNSLTQLGYIETDTSKAAESVIYQKITTGTMSQYANDQGRALLLKWIEQGAKNN